MYTKIAVDQLCAEYGTVLVSIDSIPKESYSRNTKVTVQCCVSECIEPVSKTLRNLFTSKNFGCKVHCKSFKGEKIKKTKGNLNLEIASSNDDGKRYTYEQLCKMEFRPSLFDICHKLKITQYHNMNKNSIIDAVIERQNNLDRLKGTTNETIEPNISEITEHIDSVEDVNLTKDLKTQFLEKHYFFKNDGQVWTQANLVADFLEYKDASSAIRDLVDNDDKIYFKDFPPKTRLNISNAMKKVGVSPQNHRLQQKTLFITSTAILELFMRSKLPLARLMKKWLINEVIPSIISTGTYSLNPSSLSKMSIQTAVAEPCPRTTVCYNPKGFPLSSMKSAIYILNLPLLNMYKFGYSNNLINRFKQHEYDFGEISIDFVIEAPEVQEIEKRLKNEIRSHGINTVFEIDGRKLKELFEPQYFQLMCEIISDIINKYKTDRFTSTENHDYRMISEKTKQEKEKTKQEEEKTKQKQYELELLKLRIHLDELCRKRKIEEIN